MTEGRATAFDGILAAVVLLGLVLRPWRAGGGCPAGYVLVYDVARELREIFTHGTAS